MSKCQRRWQDVASAYLAQESRPSHEITHPQARLVMATHLVGKPMHKSQHVLRPFVQGLGQKSLNDRSLIIGTLYRRDKNFGEAVSEGGA